MGTQQMCLKWNDHQANMATMCEQLLLAEAFLDVTIACNGPSLKAHKFVLSTCSPYFKSLLLENPHKHPIVIMKDVEYTVLKTIIDFMYKGEVNVSPDHFGAVLKTAKTLKVKGLVELCGEKFSHATSTPVEDGLHVATRTDSPTLLRERTAGRLRRRPKRSHPSGNDSEVPAKMERPGTPEVIELSCDETPTANISENASSSAQTLAPVTLKSSQPVARPLSKDHDFEIRPSRPTELILPTDVPKKAGAAAVKVSSSGSTNVNSVSVLANLSLSQREVSETRQVTSATTSSGRKGILGVPAKALLSSSSGGCHCKNLYVRSSLLLRTVDKDQNTNGVVSNKSSQSLACATSSVMTRRRTLENVLQKLASQRPLLQQQKEQDKEIKYAPSSLKTKRSGSENRQLSQSALKTVSSNLCQVVQPFEVSNKIKGRSHVTSFPNLEGENLSPEVEVVYSSRECVTQSVLTTLPEAAFKSSALRDSSKVGPQRMRTSPRRKATRLSSGVKTPFPGGDFLLQTCKTSEMNLGKSPSSVPQRRLRTPSDPSRSKFPHLIRRPSGVSQSSPHVIRRPSNDSQLKSPHVLSHNISPFDASARTLRKDTSIVKQSNEISAGSSPQLTFGTPAELQNTLKTLFPNGTTESNVQQVQSAEMKTTIGLFSRRLPEITVHEGNSASDPSHEKELRGKSQDDSQVRESAGASFVKRLRDCVEKKILENEGEDEIQS